MKKTLAFLLLFAMTAACNTGEPQQEITTLTTSPTNGSSTSTTSSPQASPSPSPSGEPPPAALSPGGAPGWSGPPITSGAARDVAIREWRRSQPGPQDRLILPADVRLSERSRVRRAEFGDGQWAVAWDDPGKPGVFPSGGYCTDCGRGTVGVASQTGGVDPSTGRIQLSWNEGTKVGYGPVAAVRDDLSEVPDAQWKANIQVPGHSASYILWTYGGREHLEFLLSQLRYVSGAP